MFEGIIGLISLISAIWVIYDVFAVNKKLRKDALLKIIWTIAAILFSIITAIIYYLVYKR